MEQNVRYPNLELLEYKAWKLISEKYGYTGNTRTLYRNCSADMFQQIWSDTLAGLRSSEEQIAGRQLTPEYTTVMHLYNIGSRYFVREILKSLPVTEGQRIQAKVPGCVKRSTCTLSTLISLNSALYA